MSGFVYLFGFFVGFLPQTSPELEALAAAPAEACVDSLDFAIFNAPRRPSAANPLSFVAVSAGGADGDPSLALVVYKDGQAVEAAPRRVGFEPLGVIATIAMAEVGTYRAILTRGGQPVACQDVDVELKARRPGKLKVGRDPVWETRIKWERDTENFYAVWVGHLFAAAREEELSWRRLGDVVRDPQRNLLYNYMGLNEDRDGLGLNPDCADFPYTLRAYFAWKLGLPMGMRQCRRGNPERAPTCSKNLETNSLPTEHGDRVAAFKQFFRRLKAVIHSSSPRTAAGDEDSDLYPAALTRRSLRPGTVYADPYGHTMVIAQWHPQQGDQPGLLMTVDAQPDETVGQRVFWRGNFLFPPEESVSGAGWKRFRPLRWSGGEGVPWNDARIEAAKEDYGDVSAEQYEGGPEAFHERMDALINPRPMTIASAVDAIVGALEQQVTRRVESIDTAEAWFVAHARAVIPMPKGERIFLTAGPWEDLSTPSRDMRLLIAIDVVAGLATRAQRYPKRFTDAETVDVARVKEAVALGLRAKTFTYTRSDGRKQELSLADVVARATALEIAWNPNDCPELRWGAPLGSEELSSCRRRAPTDQTARMAAEMRPWFAARQRPLQHQGR